MSEAFANLVNFLFGGLIIFVFSSQINAQPAEKLIKKLSDGREIYQRKQEIITLTDKPKVEEGSQPSQTDSDRRQQINLKIEAVLRHPGLKLDEIIWSQEISFLNEERAFNLLYISDIFVNGNELYIVYFVNLDLRVISLLKSSDGWQSEDDTYLEKTNESIYPIIEAKFNANKPQIIAKRYIFEFRSIIYEWRLKKGKWVLFSQKTVKIKPLWQFS